MRTSGKTVTQLSKIRLREELLKKLQHEAQDRGFTLNGVIVDRLERSFLVEEAFGGPMGPRVAASFALAGMHAAEFHNHPEWRDGQWARDPICFETALLALAKDLWRGHPAREHVQLSWREWCGRLYSYLTGLYHPHATSDELRTIPASYPDFEGGKYAREEAYP